MKLDNICPRMFYTQNPTKAGSEQNLTPVEKTTLKEEREEKLLWDWRRAKDQYILTYLATQSDCITEAEQLPVDQGPSAPHMYSPVKL